MTYDDTVILVYAKAPVNGTVNTRLITDIGVQAATKLQDDLIHQRLSMLCDAGLCDVHLLCAPDKQDVCFIQCSKQYTVSLFEQSGDDIGERMFNGINDALQNYQYCIVIGTDAPSLDIEKIKQAIEVLHSTADVVIVPAEDGGYVLIAMSQAYHFLFQEISWGSAEVMQQTLSKLDKKNIPYQALDTCWDIDRLEDYQRYLNLPKNGPPKNDLSKKSG